MTDNTGPSNVLSNLPPPPATKKPHQVTITEFTDDYKPRGGDWSSTSVHCFTSKRAAERFLWKYLHDWVDEQRRDDGDSDQDDDDDWREAHKSLHAMELYAQCFNHGEFVPHKLGWRIEEMVFEDDDGDDDDNVGEQCDCGVPLASEDSSDEADSSSVSSSVEMDTADKPTDGETGDVCRSGQQHTQQTVPNAMTQSAAAAAAAGGSSSSA